MYILLHTLLHRRTCKRLVEYLIAREILEIFEQSVKACATPRHEPTTGSRRNNELPLPIRAGNTITL